MSEISCRAFSYFVVAERHGLVHIDALLDGLPVTRAQLADPRNRVTWEVWATLCERAADQMGHDPIRIGRAGELVAETGERGFAGYLAPILGMLRSSEDIFRLVARWAGPSLYRSHAFACEPLSGGRLRFEVGLKPGFRPCRAWFLMVPPALQVAPRFAGLPDAVVAAEHLGDRSARFVITCAPASTLVARMTSVWAALRTPSAIVDELGFQQQQLAATLETLRKTEGGFRAALDAFPAFVVLYVDEEIIYANPATCAAIERPAHALLGQPLGALVAIEDRPRLVALLAGNPDPAPLRLLHRDGTTIHVEVGLLPPFEFGGRLARGLFAIDVSRRVKSEATTRLLLQALPDLVIRAAADGTLLDVHASTSLAEQAAALRALIGRNTSDLESRVPGVLAEHIRVCRKVFDTALATGEEQRLEFEGRWGRVRWCELRVVPQDDRREALVLVRDVTTLRETEHRLALAERMASVGTLAAGVAHEINNPLTYVLGGLDDLARRLDAVAAAGVDVTELRAGIAEVSDGAGRVRDIVAALRSYSRVDTKTAIERVSPASVVERALAMCGNQLRQGARVVPRIEPAPSVLGDASQLLQVVVNLLLNAIHALAAVDRADARIDVVVETDPRGWAVIAIGDNGSGISAAHKAHVFEPFFTTKPRGQGTGLGLSISQRIVSEHGGELRLDSELGRGSRFTVLLPPASKVPEQAERRSPPAAAPAQILVVDDEPFVARTFERALRAAGYHVRATTNSHEALALLETTSFDLVLCDLMMPGLSGMELHARVQARSPALAERFVFATGGAFSDEARALLERTTQPTLDKPFTITALHQTIADALRRFGEPR